MSRIALLCALSWVFSVTVAAQGAPGDVLAQQLITVGEGGFTGILPGDNEFGRSITALGDLDGDGVGDIAVGSPVYTDAGGNTGSVWILFLDADGTVKSHKRISSVLGGFTGGLEPGGWFGWDVECLGDLDLDGVPDLAVSCVPHAVGAASRVWILFLNRDGSVKAQQLIAPGVGGFVGLPGSMFWFGHALAVLGDVNGDGVPDLAVGSPLDAPHGAVWVLMLARDGTVVAEHAIGAAEPNLHTQAGNLSNFGMGLAAPGDLNGDGRPDLIIKAGYDSASAENATQAIWQVNLEADGSVRSAFLLADPEGLLLAGNFFQDAISAHSDFDGDGLLDIACGSLRLDLQPAQQQVLLLSMGPGFQLRRIQVIPAPPTGSPPGWLFGTGLAFLGDHDGDGRDDLAAGDPVLQIGPQGRPGGVWICFLNAGVQHDLGQGLAGSGPAPTLGLQSTFAPGAAARLELVGAPAQASSFVIVGLSQVGLPFLGGTLVPAPDLGLAFGLTDAFGSLTVDSSWPLDVPTQTTFYFQAWCADVGAPQGWAASQAVEVITP